MFKKIAIALVLVFTLTLFACDSGSKVEYPKKYGIVDVVAGEETKTGVKLTLEIDGFGSTIKAEVTVVDGKIVDYDVIENSESAGWG
ncbi:MAG: FMN-binding protein [Candidatus Izemoplasmatales bacterium]|nr:FMN-binding protein [Candidatus Izemoplasmatales bacterium]